MSEDGRVVPWDELSEYARHTFASMLNRRFDADLEVDDAERYYGNRDLVEEELGEIDRNPEGAPECPECFEALYKRHAAHLQETGRCPHCGTELIA